MKEIPGNGKLALLHIDWYPIMVNHVCLVVASSSSLDPKIFKFIKLYKQKNFKFTLMHQSLNINFCKLKTLMKQLKKSIKVVKQKSARKLNLNT